MRNVLLVGMGGFIGSALRYLVGVGVYEVVGKAWLPYGTIAVNVLGCFLIGFIGEFAAIRHEPSEHMRLLIQVGILGGFTTFSTFGYETINLLREGAMAAAMTNVALQLVCGITAVCLGLLLAQWLFRGAVS
jgi:CrcB protein